MRLRERIASTIVVNVSWTLLWVEIKGGFVAHLLWPLFN